MSNDINLMLEMIFQEKMNVFHMFSYKSLASRPKTTPPIQTITFMKEQFLFLVAILMTS